MTVAPARWLLATVRFYQRAISPAFPPRCRFEPTCSAYAAEAIELHGAARGSWLAVRRLAKCAPWHPGGVDLVPPRRDGAEPTADPPLDPGPGTAGPTQSSCTAAQPSAATASTADGTRRPDRATPPAPRRSAQLEAGVA